MLHISPTGATALAYCKRHLDTGEIGIFAAGTGPGVLEIDGWRIGLAVGRDAAVPGHAEQLVGMGADVYAVAALFRLGADERMASQMAAAAARGLWVVLAQYCGGTGGGPACGRSGVWSSDGRELVRLGTAPGLAVADVVDVAGAEAGATVTRLLPMLQRIDLRCRSRHLRGRAPAGRRRHRRRDRQRRALIDGRPAPRGARPCWTPSERFDGVATAVAAGAGRR